jgi:hypothetical protein
MVKVYKALTYAGTPDVERDLAFDKWWRTSIRGPLCPKTDPLAKAGPRHAKKAWDAAWKASREGKE